MADRELTLRLDTRAVPSGRIATVAEYWAAVAMTGATLRAAADPALLPAARRLARQQADAAQQAQEQIAVDLPPAARATIHQQVSTLGNREPG